jgi:hypothetical protein
MVREDPLGLAVPFLELAEHLGALIRIFWEDGRKGGRGRVVHQPGHHSAKRCDGLLRVVRRHRAPSSIQSPKSAPRTRSEQENHSTDRPRHSLLYPTGSSDLTYPQALRSGSMGDTIDDVSGRLRKLAVDLVRSSKPEDAAAVLVGIGAVEMLSQFGDEAVPAERVPQAALTPGY